MTQPCDKKEEIQNIQTELGGSRTALALLAQSYERMATSQEVASEELSKVNITLHKSLVEIGKVTTKQEEHQSSISILFDKTEGLRKDVTTLKTSVGGVSISGLDKRLAISELLLRGVTFIGGGVALSILGLVITAIFGEFK